MDSYTLTATSGIIPPTHTRPISPISEQPKHPVDDQSALQYASANHGFDEKRIRDFQPEVMTIALTYVTPDQGQANRRELAIQIIKTTVIQPGSNRHQFLKDTLQKTAIHPAETQRAIDTMASEYGFDGQIVEAYQNDEIKDMYARMTLSPLISDQEQAIQLINMKVTDPLYFRLIIEMILTDQAFAARVAEACQNA